ncbi:hypothetical protein RJ639_029171 [Escallonia herrerae]|uniref:Uncharacterized protein n=1 Tax=Escallonia herrerae TaxID=1293975 RepID=A0AA88X6G4_9ASTE|nr:hypothetical protein RJ639_029171 [Escallonia herrerae]
MLTTLTVRVRLHREYLVPLRKAIDMTEIYMSAKLWNELPYSRVPSVAMKIYKKKFFQNDTIRFSEYLDSYAWDCARSCGTLGLLVSDLSEEPRKGKLITFSQDPQIQIIEGDCLSSKVSSVKRMDWNVNTDFQKVRGNLTEEQMVKRLFVFSDMEFDQASLYPWETDYQAICWKFSENGYTSVPEIVFWNLRDSKATPVPSHQKGVALLSGFTKNLLKLFLKTGGIVSPEDTMNLAISGEEYEKLVIDPCSEL